MSLSFSYGFGYIPSFSQVGLVTSTESANVQVKVYPLFYDKTIVEWSIPASLGNCTFNVYGSDTGTDSWFKLNEVPLSNTNFFEDLETMDFSKFRRRYYKVEVRLPTPDNRYFTSKAITWQNTRTNLMEIRAREITRREKVLLGKFIGVDTIIFRRKYFGERCPNCYNTEIEKVVKDHCTACYGTSFLGGYFPGLTTKVHYDVSPNTTQLGYMGKSETNQSSAWTLSYPDLDSLDLLFRVVDSKIFRIDSTNSTELQTVQVRQIMQVTELGKNSVEMNLIKAVIPNKYLLPQLSGNSTKTVTGYVI